MEDCRDLETVAAWLGSAEEAEEEPTKEKLTPEVGMKTHTKEESSCSASASNFLSMKREGYVEGNEPPVAASSSAGLIRLLCGGTLRAQFLKWQPFQES